MTKDKNITSTEQQQQRQNNVTGITNTLTFSIFRILVHFLVALHHWYAIYYFVENVNIPESVHRMGNRFGGKFKYLTFLNLILQAIYFTIAFLNDIIGTNDIRIKNLPILRITKDHIFSSLAFPICIDVGFVFWILYAIDRELVLPKSFDPFFPVWLNHMLHTNILLFTFIEFFLSFRMYPKRFKGLQTLMAFLLCYLVWIHVIKHYSGIWVYPVLDVFNLQQRILFFAGMLIWSAFVYFVGEFINKRIWSRELTLLKHQKTNSVSDTDIIFYNSLPIQIEDEK